MDVRRKGYTVFEVMVTIAVAVVIASISLPFIAPMFSSGNLRAAEDLVKARWSKMRTQAVSEGRAYKFGYKDSDHKKFRIAPDSPEYWEEGAMDEVEDVELPGDIQFTQVVNPDPSSSSSNDKSQDNGDWIAFTCYPDGSASNDDFSIALGKEGSPGVTLRMRGFTGAVSSEGNRP